MTNLAIDPAAWPALSVTLRRIAGLRPHPRNARTHSDSQVLRLAESLKTWGWTSPVLVDETDQIIAGHGRVLAAQALGIEEVPAVVARGWSDAQVRAYVVADNQLALKAGWDPELLGAELTDLRDAGWDAGRLGFEKADLRALFGPERQGGHRDPDAAPPPDKVQRTRAGDLWLLGPHRLKCGDSTNAVAVADALGKVRPLLMVTDPPYGVDYHPEWRVQAGVSQPWQKLSDGLVRNDDRADWREAWALFKGDVAYVWHGGLHAGLVAESLEACDLLIRSQIIWVKSALVMGRGHYHWQHEPCWYAVRQGASGHWSGDRKQSTVWEIPIVHATKGKVDDGKTSHSTQKPVEAMRRPIENHTKVGQAVYDPFMGSGTTLIAAAMTERVCIGIEIDPSHVDIAVKRWQDFTGLRATREDGVLFDDVESEVMVGSARRRKPKVEKPAATAET